jgi:hypothetical protein
MRNEEFREVVERADVAVEHFQPLLDGQICDLFLYHLKEVSTDRLIRNVPGPLLT